MTDKRAQNANREHSTERWQPPPRDCRLHRGQPWRNLLRERIYIGAIPLAASLIMGCTTTLPDGQRLPSSQVAQVVDVEQGIYAILDANRRPLPQSLRQASPVLLPAGKYTLLLKIPKYVPQTGPDPEMAFWSIQGTLEGGHTYRVDVKMKLAGIAMLPSGPQGRAQVTGLRLLRDGSGDQFAGMGTEITQEDVSRIMGETPPGSGP